MANPSRLNVKMKGTVALVPLLCVLATGTVPAVAQEMGKGAHQQEFAGKHGRFGYRQHSHVNRDGYVSDNIYGIENLAYYGNWGEDGNGDNIYIFDIDKMELVTTVEGTGAGPYGIDQQSPDKAYALTRKTDSLTIVDNKTFANEGIIKLAHYPRSTSYNAKIDRTLVSGGNKAMTSIIKVKENKVGKVFGVDEITEPHDYGGSLSTGHPMWVTDQKGHESHEGQKGQMGPKGHKFFMLDRAAREIQLWHTHEGLLSTLTTNTSVHHIFQPPASTIKSSDEHIYYAVEEGNRDEPVSPAILRFKLHKGVLVEMDRVELNSSGIYDASKMGAHHAAFRPDGKYIYVGSAEGHLFVISREDMKVKKVIDVGRGAGHTTFISERDLAIITNHNDTFVSVIDTETHEWVRNVEVASDRSDGYKSQAHTSGVDLKQKYFYSAASHDGVFYRIHLRSWKVKKTDAVPANLLMGSFIWDADGDEGDYANSM